MTRLRYIALLLGVPGAALARDCAEIEDNAERLACYDSEHRAAAGVPGEAGAPSAPDNVTPAPAASPSPAPAVGVKEVSAESRAPVAASAGLAHSTAPFSASGAARFELRL